MDVQLRGSMNYVYPWRNVKQKGDVPGYGSTRSIMKGYYFGSGATCSVIKGYHKVTGDPVAIKVFNERNHMRSVEAQMREFQVLQKVSHENIVKLLAIEEDHVTHEKIIVMELCTGGSLCDLLREPENAFGMEESEFLLVLEHLTAGMKHLRDKGIVHRDLKPGNILRFVNHDGSSTYKLTDFGTARELQDEERFESLHGTEEYLHPDMYERVLFRGSVEKAFGVEVDLWSIGVTLYHAATGHLPFRPFGGRANKLTMHHITSKKKSGVISGIQEVDDGEIIWSKNLPTFIQLSDGLKKMMIPLLAGLLESDPKSCWRFDRFFNEVNDIIKKTPIDVFCASSGVFIKAYCDKEDGMSLFQENLASQLDIQASSQCLLHDNRPLFELVSTSSSVAAFPATCPDDPIVVYSLTDLDIKDVIQNPKIPCYPHFRHEISFDYDWKGAKELCNMGYFVRNAAARHIRQQKMILGSTVMFMVVLKSVLRELLEKVSYYTELCDCLEKRIQLFTASHEQNMQLLNKFNSNENVLEIRNRLTGIVGGKKQCAGTLVKMVKEINNKVSRVKNAVLERNVLEENWIGQEVPSAVRTSVSELDIMLRESKELTKNFHERFLEHHARINISHAKECIHQYEKNRIVKFAKDIPVILENVCNSSTQSLYSKFTAWYRQAINYRLQIDKLLLEISTLDDVFKVNDSSLDQAIETYNENFQTVLPLICQHDGSPGKQRIQEKQFRRNISKGLNQIALSNSELRNGLLENSSVLQEMTELLLSVNSSDNCSDDLEDVQVSGCS